MTNNNSNTNETNIITTIESNNNFKGETKMSKNAKITSGKSSKNFVEVDRTEAVDTSSAVRESHEVRFVQSELMGSAMQYVVFIPKNYNGLYVSARSGGNINALNAIRDFVAGNVVKAGQFVHIRNQEFSKYDGVGNVYIGGNLVKEAIRAGHRSFEIDVNGRNVEFTLPKNVDLIAEWAIGMMVTDYTGRVIPFKDEKHMNNTVNKHYFLEKLFNGSKLMVWTEPYVYEGEMKNYVSVAAHQLKADLLNEDGSFKNHEEIMTPVYERRNLVQDNFKLQRETSRLERVAPIIGLSIMSVINVNGVDMPVDQVPTGAYSSYNRSGFQQNYRINVVNNADSYNMLRTVATKGLVIKTFEG